nr:MULTISPECIES: restriction endonuclease subunit S [unclassified Streptomyces]
MSEIGKITTGSTPPRSNPRNYGNSIEWIKSDNIDNSSVYLTSAAERLSEDGAKIARIVDPGSILVTCIAGSTAAIGSSAIANRRVSFNQQINAITPFNADSLFLYYQLRLAKPLILEKVTGGVKFLVSKSRFGSVVLLNPPHAEQREFSKRAGLVLGLQDMNRAHLAELRSLFSSLQHSAFRKELLPA